ncbi:hypothetical protein IscW_ISCW010046 [Ixodes scapularis]|uniref:Uncharacterized protein n=1 Tax=Ixodes scapularis TaxID=6945 RepID=B7PZM6_IXOSC|nr:hypothetical protein IscW_ISCW010046 [Ixodes scapularis]|eukprot:XP_002405619.1 hypothetical protein IscW_ISCW010046 [Ixodes scapularis]
MTGPACSGCSTAASRASAPLHRSDAVVMRFTQHPWTCTPMLEMGPLPRRPHRSPGPGPRRRQPLRQLASIPQPTTVFLRRESRQYELLGRHGFRERQGPLARALAQKDHRPECFHR